MAHQKYADTIHVLHKCMEACNHCYDACLKEDEIDMMRDCIRLDRECADMCGFLEQALIRDTPFAAQLAKVCADICEACGMECRKHDHDHCQQCADACFRCMEACRGLAA